MKKNIYTRSYKSYTVGEKFCLLFLICFISSVQSKPLAADTLPRNIIDAPNFSSTGNYSVSVERTNSFAYQSIQERIGDSGGNWVNVIFSTNSNETLTVDISNKPDGVIIFTGVDRWVVDRLSDEGLCPQ